jgi:hypothetical protein
MPASRIVICPRRGGKSPANGHDHNGTGTGNGTIGRRIVQVRRKLDLPAYLVATDSEWDRTQSGDAWLSTTFASLTATVVCMRADLPDATRARLEAEARRLGVRLLFVHRTDDTNLLHHALPHLGEGVWRSRHLDLAIFFSPKDYEYALGWKVWKEALHKGAIHQRHALIGRAGGCRLRDLNGWAAKMNLLDFAGALGIAMPTKTTMDRYKKKMRRGLEKHPEDFLRYAAADARILLDLFAHFVSFVRQIQVEILGMQENLWQADTIPMTQGRLVASTFERWLLDRNAGAHADALRVCIRKLGFLDPHALTYQQARQVRDELLARVRRVEDLDVLAQDRGGRGLLRKFLHARYSFTALNSCGVRWWLSRATTETAGLNALVHGGRCNNERPDEYQCGPGLDIDIVGCYGANLRTLIFPVGLPSRWSYEAGERRPQLGEWLAATEAQRVDGLWTCTLSGRLPFEQDLLISKIPKGKGRRHADPDGPDLATDSPLLRREPLNAILTADFLTALKAIATHSEWSALLRLEVVTACAYLKKDRKDNVADWCATILAAPHESFRARLDTGSAQDHRPRDWYGVPLEDFVGRLADQRQHLKGQQKATADPDEKRRLDGLQTVLKLMINTLYGDFTSRHFAVGNTVLGNNITGRARLGSWMLGKPLGLRETITDGGIYTPSAVPHWRGRRPGLATLSKMWAWTDPQHGRTLAPLPGLGHWHPGIPVPADADALALAHVQKFWDPYGLKFPFELAHKLDNTFRRAAYWGKADYALLKVDGEIDHKIRGKNRKKDKDDRKKKDLTPQHDLLDNIILDTDKFPTNLRYKQRGGLLKVGMYLRAQASNTGFADIKHLRPGDDLPRKKYVARFNNLHMPIADLADFQSRQRKKERDGHEVEFFERYRARGIAFVHAKMRANKLRMVVRKAPRHGRG